MLVHIGKTSFIESHGMSASKEDIDAYVSLKFNETTFTEELQDSKNHFYIIYHNETPIGYSKIIFDVPHKNIDYKNVTKLERLYLLSDYHHLKLGLELFNFN
ncbi:MAG: GNAT family N-acetyltransferase, partial [Gelidibacter sp.]|nr:GNAT family N-acetyltransferase [Gelidibacter sp.]